MLDNMTWTCTICGDTRPDDKISVARVSQLVGVVMVDVNVRYCNDRRSCIEAAPSFKLIKS